MKQSIKIEAKPATKHWLNVVRGRIGLMLHLQDEVLQRRHVQLAAAARAGLADQGLDVRSRAQGMTRHLPRRIAHVAIRGYQLSLSGLVGRQCRHLPSCSEYTDEAIQRHGFWPGGWMGLARICRCGPFGTHGIDLVPETLLENAAWYKPWSYGRWRGVNAPPITCEAAEPDGG